jgi:hypothetical protein
MLLQSAGWNSCPIPRNAEAGLHTAAAPAAAQSAGCLLPVQEGGILKTKKGHFLLIFSLIAFMISSSLPLKKQFVTIDVRSLENIVIRTIKR